MKEIFNIPSSSSDDEAEKFEMSFSKKRRIMDSETESEVDKRVFESSDSQGPVAESNNRTAVKLNNECLRAIFSFLSREDQLNCALVSKNCNQIVRQLISSGTLNVDYRLTRKIAHSQRRKLSMKEKGITIEDQDIDISDLQQLIKKFYRHASQVTIDYGVKVPPKYLNATFFLRKSLKRLVLCGSILWSDCRCAPVNQIYKQIDPNDLEGSLEKLDTLIVSSTVKINACALLDLICRAPKLRVLKFHGAITCPEHWMKFLDKPFPGSLKTLQWPWVDHETTGKVIELIIQKNMDLENIDCASTIVCRMLSQGKLHSLKRLVLRLSEIWKQTSSNDDHVTNIKYLDLAKKLISLEIRSYDFEDAIESTDDSQEQDRYTMAKYRYRKQLWDSIEKMVTIKALTVYGCWDFNATCREVSKFAKNIEYFKINLLPDALREHKAETGGDKQDLKIEDGLTNLGSLPNLKSLHIICSEKLNNITPMTCNALTRLADKLWILDVKVNMSEDVKQLIFNIQRRGNPLNRTYKLSYDVVPKIFNLCEIVVEHNIGAEGTRYKSIEDLGASINRTAQAEANARQPGSTVADLALWGLALAPSMKCKKYYELKSDWDYYCEHFAYDQHLQM